MRLLSQLLDLLFPPRDTERLVREATPDAMQALVQPKERNGCTSLLPYRHPLVRALILEAKFRNNGRAQELLGLVLRNYLHDREAMLLPIPLGPTRLKERGYNQVEEVIKKGGLSMDAQILNRVRETAPQTEQSGRNRRENVKSAFVATGIDPSVSYIVIDDVCTTGATLHAAANALVDAGASAVTLVALAH